MAELDLDLFFDLGTNVAIVKSVKFVIRKNGDQIQKKVICFQG